MLKNSAVVISAQKDVFSEVALSEKIRKVANKILCRNLKVCEMPHILGYDGLLLFAVISSIVFLIPVSVPFSVLETFMYFGLILFINFSV